MIDVTFRPLEIWPGPETPVHRRRRSQFRAGWSSTMELLDKELRALGARRVVIQLALQESDIRLDGWPRAASRPAHSGVVIAFESKHGPLKYHSDQFNAWQDNLRAIALGLEALRAVDRYGITHRGEQYAGWKQLAAGGPTPEQGAALIREHGGLKAALFATHPDHGGDPEQFAAVQAAREAGLV